ncbi:hypothetical protein [Candidatus Enterovibrio escicola]|nr:hypothetical protein [Candidatus Enterovibrio escacola]
MNNLDAVFVDVDDFSRFSSIHGKTPHSFRYQTKKQTLSSLS